MAADSPYFDCDYFDESYFDTDCTDTTTGHHVGRVRRPPIRLRSAEPPDLVDDELIALI